MKAEKRAAECFVAVVTALSKEINLFPSLRGLFNQRRDVEKMANACVPIIARHFKEAVEEAVENAKFTYCAYCGAEFPVDGAQATTAIGEHIATCEKHPMRAAEHRAEEWETTATNLLRRAEEAEAERKEAVQRYEAAEVRCNDLSIGNNELKKRVGELGKRVSILEATLGDVLFTIRQFALGQMYLPSDDNAPTWRKWNRILKGGVG